MARITFGSIVKQRRLARGMTQRDLAGRLKVKASYIAYLEGNERRPSIEFLVKLVKALNLDGRQMFLLAYPGAKSLIQRR